MKKKYSLWLIPEERVNRKYQKIISGLALTYETQEFKPHVTLIKNLELDEKDVLLFSNELIKLLSSIKTKFTELGHSDRWYRNLYLKVLRTPELIELHERANKIFGHTEELFMPHLSLVYGNLPLNEKMEIIKRLNPFDDNYFILNKLVVTEESEVWKEIISYDLK